MAPATPRWRWAIGRHLGERTSVLRRVVPAMVALLVAIAAGGQVAATADVPSPAPSAVASGGVGLRLVDVPAATRDDPRAALYIVDHLPRGAAIHRRVQVSNTSTSPVQISLYTAAASIARGVFVGAEARTANDLSTWTSVNPGLLTLPRGGTADVTVTIAVPKDAAPGESYGALWAEARAPSSPQGVTEVNRVGLRLYISVGSGGAPAPDFTIESLTAERSAEGLPVVLAKVRNSGGRALDMSGSLALALVGGPGGLNAGPYPATLGTTLAIKDTEIVRVTLDRRVPAGPWSARMTLRSGLLERTEQATLTFPETGDSVTVDTRSSPPWFAYGALAALIGGVVVVVTRRRRRTDCRG
jgi:hypothetical protein